MMVEILLPQKWTNYQSPTQWALSYTVKKSWCCHCYLRPHVWNTPMSPNQSINNQPISVLLAPRTRFACCTIAGSLRADLLGSLGKDWHLLAGEVNVSTCVLLFLSTKDGAKNLSCKAISSFTANPFSLLFLSHLCHMHRCWLPCALSLWTKWNIQRGTVARVLHTY